MQNILSYKYPATFTGKEISDWAHYHFNNRTSHYQYARMILNRYWNLNPNQLYTIRTNYSGTGAGEIVHKPLIVRVKS